MKGIGIVYLADFIIAILGLIFAGVAIGVHTSNKRKIERCQNRTSATVVEMQRERSYDGIDHTSSVSWFPVFEYIVNGKTIRKRSRFGQSGEIFYAGQQVDLFYNIKNYNEYYVPEEHTGKFSLIFGLVGGGLIMISVIMFFIVRALM